MPGGYVDYNLLGGELAVTYRPGWAIGFNIGTPIIRVVILQLNRQCSQQ